MAESELAQRAKKLPAAEFFSRPFIQEALQCTPRLASVTARLLREAAQENETLGDFLSELETGDIKFGRDNSVKRKTIEHFHKLLGKFEIQLPKDIERRRAGMSVEALALLELLKANKEA